MTVRPLLESVVEARARTLGAIADLTDEELGVPYLSVINPLLWEVGHAAYFQEWWLQRQAAGLEPLRPDVDSLFDSIHIAHEARWRLPIPSRAEVVAYAEAVLERTLTVLTEAPEDERLRYLAQYSVLHEDMHAEALTMTRQVVGLAAPRFCRDDRSAGDANDAETGDVAFDAATLIAGACDDGSFCFDNEKWEHEIAVGPFALARSTVSEGEFAAFVDDGGYDRRELWSRDGWAWRLGIDASLPAYWRRTPDGGFERRTFDRWEPLDPTRAMQHVAWFEADAWARWAKRRLPTEAEWEFAARQTSAQRENVGWNTLGTCRARTGSGLRQLLGDVWEWTATTFAPYPGFVPDMYHDYSTTSFHTRRVLRGGSWASSPRIARAGFRNFYQPGRRDAFAGFRTCAL